MGRPSRVGRPRKDTDRASAREVLLTAAHELMSERDSIDVPLIDIAQRAQLNVALVTYYFGGKDALLLELALRHQARFGVELERLLDRPDTAEAKLAIHIRAMVRAYRRVPFLQRLNHKILRDSTEEAARALAKALVEPLRSFYVRLVDQGVAEGVFRRVDPMHLYLTTLGACDMLFSARTTLRFGFGVDQIDDDLAEAYAKHLQTTLRAGLLALPE
jgi:AcrR family transcriptional regulator